MHIKILGTGCAKCNSLERKVKEIIEKNNIDAIITKVTDLEQISRYGIIMTPGLVVMKNSFALVQCHLKNKY